MKSKPSIRLRAMVRQDILAGLSLCRTAGWNQTAGEWEFFLNGSPDGCRVATDEQGQVVGTVTTLRYQDHFSWVGMVLVDPARQRQGIGLALLDEALGILNKESTVKLDATPAGREVYLSRGFQDEYRIIRMHWSPDSSGKLPLSDALPMTQDDFSELLELDRAVFGADREPLLQWMIKRSPELAFVVREKNKISGYSFGRHGHLFMHIGPVIAQNARQAMSLIAAGLQNNSDRKAVMDVLEGQASWAEQLGWVNQRPLIRMFKGSNSYPGKPENQFAILGPEFG